MKHIFTVGFICVTTFSLKAQITLNQANAFDAGHRYINGQTYSNLSPSIVPGNAGPSQTWNFTTTAHDFWDTMNVVAIGWIPSQFSAPYPQSTLAFYYGSWMNAYDMARSDANGVYLDGYVLNDPQFGILDQHYIDPMQYMSWPLTYGTIFYDTAYSDFTFPTTGPSDSTRQVVDMYTTSEADAWGTLTTSYGTYNALRVKRTYSYQIFIASHDSVSGWSAFTPYTFVGRTYEWWTNTPGIGMPVVNITVDYTTDTVQSYSIMTNYTVGTPENYIPVNEISLYPNPAKDYITLIATATSKWEIVDLTGKIVKSGVMSSDHVAIGVGDLSTGIYLLQTIDESGISRSRKFVVE